MSHIHFQCICEYWQGKFWRIAHDSPNLPIFPYQIFPIKQFPWMVTVWLHICVHNKQIYNQSCFKYRKQKILHGTKPSQFSRIFDKTWEFSLLISMARSNMYCNYQNRNSFPYILLKNQWTAKVLYRLRFVVYDT